MKKFGCNDCDRTFDSEKAWKYHGEGTGHNINGDLPAKWQRELSAVQALSAELETVKIERDRAARRLNAVVSVLQL